MSERIISMFEVATRVLGLDEETRDALFFGLGEKRSRHLARVRHDGPDMTADQHVCLRKSGASASANGDEGIREVADAERLLHRGDHR